MAPHFRSRPDSVSSQDGGMTIGRWHVQPAVDTVTLNGAVTKLEPRTMRLLLALAEMPGEVRSANWLIERVWPGLVVTDASLYQAIGDLRQALKPDTETAEFIKTVPRKGYRLVAPVRSSSEASPPNKMQAPERPTLGARSVAVLPFRDLGLPASHAFVRLSLLGDLIIQLSRQPGLTVIGLGTMMQYDHASETPKEIARSLGVRYVVDGTLAWADGAIRIGLELVDAATGAVTAGETLCVPLDQWGASGSAVAGRLARGLQIDVAEALVRDPPPARAAVTAMSASDASAVAAELAMRAWVALYGRPQSHATNEEAWSWATQALALNARSGQALNALAYCEWRAAQYGWHAEKSRDALLRDALEHARGAVALAPQDPDAHYTLGLVTYNLADTSTARAMLEHCIALCPSYAPAHGLLGMVHAVQGFPGETFIHCERAFVISPKEPLRSVWRWIQGCAASMMGDEPAALDYATKGIAANAGYPNVYVIAIVAAHRLGHTALASRYVEILRGKTRYRFVEDAIENLPPLAVTPWGPAFVADLQAAGLPSRGP
jgi:DNA-binding winged helix-turn-helix (wHTH) protein/tetratricopeptide (TPR) repeat protein